MGLVSTNNLYELAQIGKKQAWSSYPKMKNTNIFVFYFCPPLNMSFEVYLLLCRLSFYMALLMWDTFYKILMTFLP